MDGFKLTQFSDDREFEDFLIDFHQFVGWDLFQDHIVTMPHMTFGLFGGDELLGAAKVSRLKDDLIYVHLFQVREDLQGRGIGRHMWEALMREFLPSCSGFMLCPASSAVGFWVRMGFWFDDRMEFMVR